MRKKNVPMMFSGPVVKVFAFCLCATFCGAVLIDPKFERIVPGILDGLIGLVCGVGCAVVGWKWAKANTKGSSDLFKPVGWFGHVPQPEARVMFVAAMLSTTLLGYWLRDVMGLGWPWFRSGTYVSVADMVAFVAFPVSYLLCIGRWYDRLPD